MGENAVGAFKEFATRFKDQCVPCMVCHPDFLARHSSSSAVDRDPDLDEESWIQL